MKNYRTPKQEQYFDEVIRLHYEKGYGEFRIARVLPISHATAGKWISLYAKENNLSVSVMRKNQPQTAREKTSEKSDVKTLQSKIACLEQQLKMAEIKSEVLDEMINVAETQFNIPIRKKAGAKR